MHASRPFREMIARPKISRNEWKTAEIGAFEVGNFALFSCPGERVALLHLLVDGDQELPPPAREFRRRRPVAAVRDVLRVVGGPPRARHVEPHLGSKKVIQRRFNVSVPRARVPERASTLRDRSER